MKTIITTLPIYDRLEKQCYERSKHATNNAKISIVCPRHRLPSFQWLDDTDGAASVTSIGLVNTDNTTTDITSYFSSLPSISHDYFTYSGDTLVDLLPAGEHFLVIIMNNGHTYYSEWFKVDCIYNNLISGMTNSSYETFTFDPLGLFIMEAINTAGNGFAKTTTFSIINNESIRISFYLVLSSGQLPTIILYSDSLGSIASQPAVSGNNVITLQGTSALSDVSIAFYNTSNSEFRTTTINVFRVFASKYITLNFSNVCDLGNIYYHGGFTQTLWFESEPMEISFPMEEDGAKNGEGRFVRSFARQEKKYIARTKQMPDYMVDVFNRMRLHDTIELIDLLGDSHYVYNLEVDHEWMDDDKYYARITLTFDYDEAFVVGGCCNNIS